MCNIYKSSLRNCFHRLRVWFLFALTISFFSSCAFHKTFPFICFKKACVKEQFDHPGKQIGGYKKGAKPKTSARKKKLRKKRKKKQSELASVSFPPMDKSPLDLLISDTILSKESIKIVFHYKVELPEKVINKDSVFIKSSFLTLSKNDILKINYYLDKYSVKNIDEVFIIPIVDNKSEDFKKNNRLAGIKVNKLAHYLIKTGIKKKKIKIS